MLVVLFIFVPFLFSVLERRQNGHVRDVIPTTTIVTYFPSRGAHADMLNLLVPRRIANRAVKLGSDPSSLLHGVEQAIVLRDRHRLGHHDRHYRAPDAHDPIRAREQLGAHLDTLAAAGIERPRAASQPWSPRRSHCSLLSTPPADHPHLLARLPRWAGARGRGQTGSPFKWNSVSGDHSGAGWERQAVHRAPSRSAGRSGPAPCDLPTSP